MCSINYDNFYLSRDLTYLGCVRLQGESVGVAAVETEVSDGCALQLRKTNLLDHLTENLGVTSKSAASVVRFQLTMKISSGQV